MYKENGRAKLRNRRRKRRRKRRGEGEEKEDNKKTIRGCTSFMAAYRGLFPSPLSVFFL